MPPGYRRNVVPAVWFRSPSRARDAHQRAQERRDDVMGQRLVVIPSRHGAAA